MQDDVDECRTTYEALNSQLVEELPKLLELGLHIYTASFNEFIRNRKRLVGRITKELLDLMDVRLHSSGAQRLFYAMVLTKFNFCGCFSGE